MATLEDQARFLLRYSFVAMLVASETRLNDVDVKQLATEAAAAKGCRVVTLQRVCNLSQPQFTMEPFVTKDINSARAQRY